MCPNTTPPTPLDADQVNHFRLLLEVQIDKFNSFFVDKEEEYIIKCKVTSHPIYIVYQKRLA